MIGPATRLVMHLCPYCGYAFDAASGIGDRGRPRRGDFTLCIECAALLVFDRRLHAVKPVAGLFERACKEDKTLAARIAYLRGQIQALPRRPPRVGPLN